MYNEEKKTDDSYFFTAEHDGKYVFCLANQKSSLVPKLVYFMFDFLNDEKRYQENEDGHNKTGMCKGGILDGIFRTKRNFSLSCDYLDGTN